MNAPPQYVLSPAQLKASLDAFQATRDHLMKNGQHLLARIRKTSKYHPQTNDGELFPVAISPGGEYCVQARTNQYRLEDVDLFAVFDGQNVQIN